jgi:hypothetical protein
MDRPKTPYLLTYESADGEDTFLWFETEEAMNAFIEVGNVNVMEAWYINDAKLLR